MKRNPAENLHVLLNLEKISVSLHTLNDSEAMLSEAIEHWPPSDRHQAARSIANITREVSIMLFQLSGYIQ
jgi:hypothetical protein